MRADTLNPDAALYAAAKKLFGEKPYPAPEYRCHILQPEKQSDISSAWAYTLGSLLPTRTPEAIAAELAAELPNCRADGGFLNFTFDAKVLTDEMTYFCSRFFFSFSPQKTALRPNDEDENFLPVYFLYKAAERQKAGASFAEAADFTELRQRRIAGLIAWCDILREKHLPLRPAVKILAEQVYFWERLSQRGIEGSVLFGAAGYIFSLCV